MNPFLISFLWIACLTGIGGLVLLDPDMSADTLRDDMRLLLPGILIASIFVYEKISGLKFRNLKMALFRRVLAVPFLILSMNWIAIFTLTSYRSHHRAIILPLSLFFLCIAIMLTHWRIYKTAVVKGAAHIRNIILFSCLLTLSGCDSTSDHEVAVEREVKADPIRAFEQAKEDIRNGSALIYYSGPHSGYDEPTPVGLPESDWAMIEDLPRNYRGKVMASVPFFKAGQYNEAVVKALRNK